MSCFQLAESGIHFEWSLGIIVSSLGRKNFNHYNWNNEAFTTVILQTRMCSYLKLYPFKSIAGFIEIKRLRLIKEYMPHRLEWLASQNCQICLCVCTVAHFSWEKWLRYFVVTIWNKGLLATLPMEESWSRTNLPGINWWLFMFKK